MYYSQCIGEAANLHNSSLGSCTDEDILPDTPNSTNTGLIFDPTNTINTQPTPRRDTHSKISDANSECDSLDRCMLTLGIKSQTSRCPVGYVHIFSRPPLRPSHSSHLCPFPRSPVGSPAIRQCDEDQESVVSDSDTNASVTTRYRPIHRTSLLSHRVRYVYYVCTLI